MSQLADNQDPGAAGDYLEIEEEPAEPRSLGFADAVAVIRRRRLLILVATVLFGAAALLWSSSREERYEATAQVLFRDIFTDLQVISEGSGVPETSPTVRAAENAELVERPEVLQASAKKLETTPDSVEDAVETQVGSQTNFVDITAESGSAERAAEIANAVADQVLKLGTQEQLDRLDEVAAALTDQVKEAKKARKDDFFDPEGVLLESLQAQLARVETLRVFTDPVQIASRATVPEDPAGPDTLRNTVLGLLLGLAVGMSLAFGRDALDRRARSAAELGESLEAPVLATIPGGTLARGLGAIRDEQFEPMRQLRVNLRRLGARGRAPRSVVVTGARGGDGAAAVAAGLASAAALTGMKVLLVEGDMRRPTLARRMNIAAAPGLADHLAGEADPRDVLQVVGLPEPGGAGAEGATLVCMTAGTQMGSPPELLAGARFEALIEKVGHAYDLVVISAPPLTLADPLEISPLVDAAVVAVKLADASEEALVAIRAAMAGFGETPAGLVITDGDGGDDGSGGGFAIRGLGRS